MGSNVLPFQTEILVANPQSVRPLPPTEAWVGARNNGDGTATVRLQLADGSTEDRTMPVAEAQALRGRLAGTPQPEVLGRAIGAGLSDCTFCRYGKPAIAGAVAGLALASVAGYEPTRGLVWGGVGGLLYGHVRG